MKIIDIIISPVAQDPDNEYEKIRWRCAGCDHGNINELSKTKIENWKMEEERVYLSWDWDCKWCRRTNHITVGFDRSGEERRRNDEDKMSQ